MHAQLVIDNRPCAFGRAHPAGASGAEGRGAALRCGGQEFIVGLHLWPGQIPVAATSRERRRCQRPPAEIPAPDDRPTLPPPHPTTPPAHAPPRPTTLQP